MSYMFAVKCAVRRIEIGRSAVSEKSFQRLLVITHVNYPNSTISVSDYGPDISLRTLEGPVRFSLMGATTRLDLRSQWFSLLFQRPPNGRTRGLFVPAHGDAKVRWSGKRPSLQACFLAPLTADFARARDAALWVIEGRYFAWDRELLDSGTNHDFSGQS